MDDNLLDTGRECNVFLNVNLAGGSGECDICFGPGEFVCRECQNEIICKECCDRVNQHPKRAHHKPSSNDTGMLASTVSFVTIMKEFHDKSFPSDHEFPFLDSPSLNETFEHATEIATLAECFSITTFNDFQELVIDNTLAGRDSISEG